MKLPSDRVFGLSFACLFLVVFAIGWLLFDKILAWAAITSILLALVALIKPGILMPLNRLWGKLVPLIAMVTNGIVLGLAFLLVIVPMGTIMRMLGRDPLRRKYAPMAETYWSRAEYRKGRDSYSDIF